MENKSLKTKQGKWFKICKRCEKGFAFNAFGVDVKKRKYCSKDCANKANAERNSLSKRGKKNPMYGKKAWNYIDGRGGKRHPTMRYWEWRRKVFNRDKNICQKCKKKFSRKKLVAHHKKSWKKYPKLRYKVGNGITYCRPCHNKIDKDIKKQQYE